VTPDGDSDADLARRSLAGDRRAFGLLARRHGPKLARTVRALGVAPSDVEDVVQNALVAAWRALADYDPARPFLGWCSTIAANKARDWRRHRRVRVPWFEGAPLDRPEAGAVEEPNAGPAVEADRDQLRRVERALQALPPRLSVPLVLVTATGLTQREAAAALGVSPKTVETRIARARLLLTAALGSG
jgi:RNA polymerase sigma-70 factor (ECF subfamily)